MGSTPQEAISVSRFVELLKPKLKVSNGLFLLFCASSYQRQSVLTDKGFSKEEEAAGV